MILLLIKQQLPYFLLVHMIIHIVLTFLYSNFKLFLNFHSIGQFKHLLLFGHVSYCSSYSFTRKAVRAVEDVFRMLNVGLVNYFILCKKFQPACRHLQDEISLCSLEVRILQTCYLANDYNGNRILQTTTVERLQWKQHDGKKLSILSTSRTPAAKRGAPSMN